DRHDFIPAALERGAVALVVDREVTVPTNVTVARTPSCWRAIAAMACEYFGQPARQLVAVGITGTSGKTSTSYFVESMLAAARLFEALGQSGKDATAVVNSDDPSSARIIAANRGGLITYGTQSSAEVRASDTRMTLSGTFFQAHSPLGDRSITLRHLGEYQTH